MGSLIARLTALSAVCLLGGCAWYAPGSEHYFGPVFFRYTEASERSTLVAEIVRPVAAGEGGTQWGITVGVAQRLMVAPQNACVDDGKAVSGPRVAVAFSPFGAPNPTRWNFSPFYLRVDHLPQGRFVSRTMYGAEATAGQEVGALSLGAVFRTLFRAPDDSLVRLHFDADRPMETMLSICRDVPGQPLPLTAFEEIER